MPSGWPDPYRHVGWFQRAGGHLGQVGGDRVQVDCVLQPGRERHHGLVGVIPDPVEPAVHRGLDSAAQRVEQRGDHQRGGRHCNRAVERQHPSGQQHQACVQADQQAGDDGVGQGAADDAVDVVQPVLKDRDRDRDRDGQHGDHQPALGDTASNPGAQREYLRHNRRQHQRQRHQAARIGQPLNLQPFHR